MYVSQKSTRTKSHKALQLTFSFAPDTRPSHLAQRPHRKDFSVFTVTLKIGLLAVFLSDIFSGEPNNIETRYQILWVPNNIETRYQIRRYQIILDRVPNSIKTGYLFHWGPILDSSGSRQLERWPRRRDVGGGCGNNVWIYLGGYPVPIETGYLILSAPNTCRGPECPSGNSLSLRYGLSQRHCLRNLSCPRRSARQCSPRLSFKPPLMPRHAFPTTPCPAAFQSGIAQLDNYATFAKVTCNATRTPMGTTLLNRPVIALKTVMDATSKGTSTLLCRRSCPFDRV